LQQLLCHTRRPLFVLWDSVGPHRAAAVQRFIAAHRRLHVFRLPAYCPELNPDEWFWSHLKCRQLANLGPADVEQLKDEIRKAARRIRRRPALTRPFYRASGLVRYLCRDH
jgi:transposase